MIGMDYELMSKMVTEPLSQRLTIQNSWTIAVPERKKSVTTLGSRKITNTKRKRTTTNKSPRLTIHKKTTKKMENKKKKKNDYEISCNFHHENEGEEEEEELKTLFNMIDEVIPDGLLGEAMLHDGAIDLMSDIDTSASAISTIKEYAEEEKDKHCTIVSWEKNHAHEIVNRLNTIKNNMKDIFHDVGTDTTTTFDYRIHLFFQCKEICELILYITQECNPFKNILERMVYDHNDDNQNDHLSTRISNDNNSHLMIVTNQTNLLKKLLHIQNLMRYFIANINHYNTTRNMFIDDSHCDKTSSAITKQKSLMTFCNVFMIIKYSDMSKFASRDIHIVRDYGKYVSVEIRVKTESMHALEVLVERISNKCRSTIDEIINIHNDDDYYNLCPTLQRPLYIEKAITMLENIACKMK